MRKSLSKLTALLLSLALTLAMAAPALAEMEDLVIHKPAAGSTYYRGYNATVNAAKRKTAGETVPVYVETESLTADYLIKFTCKLCPKGTTKVVWTKNSGTPAEEVIDFKTSFSTKDIKAGAYRFDTYMYAHYNSEDTILNNDARKFCAVYIRNLKAPTKLTPKAGKKKVTVTWKKAAGASKTEIWRSTKKNSGFKRIKVTAGSKFVDKGVKKGKKYYYRARTIRSAGKGTVYSAFGAKVITKAKVS